MSAFSRRTKIIAIIGILVLGLIVAGLLFISDLMKQAERDRQFSNFKQIDIALATYTKNHGQQFPPSLDELKPFLDMTEAEFQKAVSNVEYYGAGKSKIDSPRLLILATKPFQEDKGQGRIVLRNDSSVRLMDQSAFEEALAGQQNPE